MSTAQVTRDRRPTRRVRHEVRDGLALMVFSLAASSSLALGLLLLARLGRTAG